MLPPLSKLVKWQITAEMLLHSFKCEIVPEEFWLRFESEGSAIKTIIIIIIISITWFV